MKNLCLVSKITLKNIRNPGILCDRLDSVFSVESCGVFFPFFFFFLLSRVSRREEVNFTVHDKCHCSRTVLVLFIHCLWDS